MESLRAGMVASALQSGIDYVTKHGGKVRISIIVFDPSGDQTIRYWAKNKKGPVARPLTYDTSS
jgi:hypothetical protein